MLISIVNNIAESFQNNLLADTGDTDRQSGHRDGLDSSYGRAAEASTLLRWLQCCTYHVLYPQRRVELAKITKYDI